jgi:hypothetical protein
MKAGGIPMRTDLHTWLRVLAVSLGLSVATARAEAAPTRETLWGLPRQDPAIAVGAIIGGIVVVSIFAWIAARTGDKA